MDKKEHFFYILFNISIVLKGLHALFEIASGIFVFFINRADIVNFVLALTQEELLEDPRDPLVHLMIHTVTNLSVSSQHFVGWYLLVHGAVNIFPIYGLLRQQLWAYPTAIFILIGFIAYQIFRYFYTFSPWLIIFSVIDLFILYLVFHEYRYLKKHLKFQ
ncbi:MAG: DUF2127 domain-containing protein [Gammaproteobacteria bacterium]